MGDMEEAPLDPIVVGDVSAGDYIGPTMAYFDIETTDLKGNFGRMLCASITDAFGNTETYDYTTYPGVNSIDDSGLAAAFRDALEKYDIWVSWNGKLFDVPFINARLMRRGLAPLRKDRMHIDLMYYATGQFMRMGSRALNNVARFFRSDHQKTPLDPEIWALAGTGDKESLDFIIEHNIADCLVLRDVYAHLRKHITVIHR
jgi:uncharacterized protein YprB with RNaseH-like and TPR domain